MILLYKLLQPNDFHAFSWNPAIPCNDIIACLMWSPLMRRHLLWSVFQSLNTLQLTIIDVKLSMYCFVHLFLDMWVLLLLYFFVVLVSESHADIVYQNLTFLVYLHNVPAYRYSGDLNAEHSNLRKI